MTRFISEYGAKCRLPQNDHVNRAFAFCQIHRRPDEASTRHWKRHRSQRYLAMIQTATMNTHLPSSQELNEAIAAILQEVRLNAASPIFPLRITNLF